MAKLKGKLVVGFGGGPTAVINQSMVGVVLEAMKHEEITAIYGSLHGAKGILAQKLVDLKKETRETLEAVAATPSAGLGSTRWKPNDADCEQILDTFKKHGVRYFFYIGGNDTAEASDIINRMASAAHYELRIFHVPKTVDNDLVLNDHCPGFPSAAKYVASMFMGDNLDNMAMPGIKINVIMGRHAGWLTGASVLAREVEGDGPHLIYLPERVFDRVQFLVDVRKAYEKYGRCVVALSEGVHDASGQPIFTTGEKDKFGNIQLSGSGGLGDYVAAIVKDTLAKDLGIKEPRVRADTLGYAQRCFPLVSEVDAREARESGAFAVKTALSSDTDGSITIKRLPGKGYAVEYKREDLASVAKKTRTVDNEFIAPAGNDVTPAFVEYVRPLAGTLPTIGRLARHPVKKID